MSETELPVSQTTITRIRMKVAWAETNLKKLCKNALKHLPFENSDGVQVSPSHSLDNTYDEVYRRGSQSQHKDRIASDTSVRSVWSADSDRQVDQSEEDLNASVLDRPPPKSAFKPYCIHDVLVAFKKS